MAPIPFDDRDGKIWHNGQLVEWRDARIHVLNHGLHYGSSVFEGERAYEGRIFKSREHSQRLHASAEIMGMVMPYSVDALEAAKAEVLAANGIVDGYVRAFAWRGSEMMAVAAQQTRIHVAIAAWPWPNLFGDSARAGISLTVAKYRRPDPACAPVHAKAAGLYMICTLSKHEAEQQGFNDALMLDWRGLVAEATGANVFFVMDGKLHTPLADCFLNGITRRTVIGLARDLGYEVIERRIAPEELVDAQEMFLTGTAAEVTPVGRLDDHQFQIGQVTTRIREAYHALVRRAPEAAVAAE